MKIFSENTTESIIQQIHLNRNSESVDSQISKIEFSPNNDKINDYLIFKNIIPNEFKNIERWQLKIYQPSGRKDEKIYKLFKGDGEIPEIISWDGKGNNNKTLDDDEYFYKLMIVFKGQEIESYPKKIIINTDKPIIKFDLSSPVFTPDGDENQDRIEIYPIIKGISIKTWKLTLVEKYYKDNVSKIQIIKKWKGYGHPGNRIVWDGLSDNGFLIGSLSDLELHFSFRNDMDEVKIFSVNHFNTGIMVNQGKNNTYSISIPEFILTRNEDKILNNIKKILDLYPGYKVQVQSHSKQPGNNDENMMKSESRVREVFKKIFDRNNDFDRYSYMPYGEIMQLFDDEDDYKQERNHRIDFVFSLPILR